MWGTGVALLSSSKSLTGHPKRSPFPSISFLILLVLQSGCGHPAADLTIHLNGFEKNEATVFITRGDATNPETLFSRSNLFGNQITFELDLDEHGPEVKIELISGDHREAKVLKLKSGVSYVVAFEKPSKI